MPLGFVASGRGSSAGEDEEVDDGVAAVRAQFAKTEQSVWTSKELLGFGAVTALGMLLFPVLTYVFEVAFDATNETVGYKASVVKGYVEAYEQLISLVFGLLLGNTYFLLGQQRDAAYTYLFSEAEELHQLLEEIRLRSAILRSLPGQDMVAVDTFETAMLAELDAYVTLLYVKTPYRGGLVPEWRIRRDVEPSEIMLSFVSDNRIDPVESMRRLVLNFIRKATGEVGDQSDITLENLWSLLVGLSRARALTMSSIQNKVPKLQWLILRVLAGLLIIGFPATGFDVTTVEDARAAIADPWAYLTLPGVLCGLYCGTVWLVLDVTQGLGTLTGANYNVRNVVASIGIVSERSRARRKELIECPVDDCEDAHIRPGLVPASRKSHGLDDE